VREASEQRLTLHTLLQMMPAKSLIQFSDKYKALSPSLSLFFLLSLSSVAQLSSVSLQFLRGKASEVHAEIFWLAT